MHLFGKDLSDVSWFHQDLLSKETELLAVQKRTEAKYFESPERQSCILCNSNLSGSQRFRRNQIDFVFCEVCGHVNGNHEVTSDFVSATYTSSDSLASETGVYDDEFTQGKMASDYWEVVDRIYMAKANFLKDFVKSQKLDPASTSILDAGCGSGHFVNALLKSGFRSSKGFDSFSPAIEASRLIGQLSEDQVSLTVPEELIPILSDTDATIVSMMCVLVHLESPINALEAMKNNNKTRFTLQKIPMWSFATILEAAFPEFRSRVLGSDHTNVFTEESLAWLERKLGLKRVASWTFGGDYLDLQRKTLAGMQQNGSSKELIKRAAMELSKISNDIQLAIDTHKLSSELHVIWEF